MSPVHSAPQQLISLAAEMRPDWDPDQLQHALMAAKAANWSWARTFMLTARLLADENASPRDLAAEARNPLKAADDVAEPSDEYRQLRQAYAPGGDAA